ncbi:MAG: S-layer homology domain-containing protein, partial [Synergistaceae bacterium]|nr:S-layer homology domain-containing protein [Synergistaceae bacterium]
MKKILAAVILAALVTFAAPAMADSNPFADVPAGHWSYDAVALLASRGVVSGYPDGQYKGGQLATRYEMASVVARALVSVDEGKASKEDLELIKKLVAEYKNELDALGVKVADLDKRVAGLEKGLKGLRLKGIFWLDAEWSGSDKNTTQPAFSYHRARFFIEKQVDENTFFQMRLNFTGLENKGKNFRVDRLWFSTKLPWDIVGKFGYQTSDWDSEYGLWNAKYGGWGDEDSLWTNLKFMGFDFRKDFGKFDVDLYVGRNTQNIDSVETGKWDDQSFMTAGLKIGYKSEKLKLGIFGRASKYDGNRSTMYESGPAMENPAYEYFKDKYHPYLGLAIKNASILNYGVYANYKLFNGLELKGTFNHQEYMGNGATAELYGYAKNADGGYDAFASGNKQAAKNADMWSAAMEVDQSVLKLFSLWVQYGMVSEGFHINENAFNQIGYSPAGSHELSNFDVANNGIISTGFDWFK